MVKTGLLVALVLGAACGDPEGDGLDQEEVEQGSADCAHEITLAPEAGGFVASETVAGLEVDGEGVDLCLHLDGTANARNHFAAGSDQEPGEVSSFALLLLDEDGRLLVEGWDVTFGGEGASTFANLEYGPWAPEVPREEHLADVVLRVATRDGALHATSIDVALFDPLE